MLHGESRLCHSVHATAMCSAGMCAQHTAQHTATHEVALNCLLIGRHAHDPKWLTIDLHSHWIRLSQRPAPTCVQARKSFSLIQAHGHTHKLFLFPSTCSCECVPLSPLHKITHTYTNRALSLLHALVYANLSPC